MLTFFTVKRHYCGLDARLYVDGEHQEAEISLSYNRLIVAGQAIPFSVVATPEKAEAWLSRPMGERGSFLETMQWQYSRQPQSAAA
jgi:hypothetical protein